METCGGNLNVDIAITTVQNILLFKYARRENQKKKNFLLQQPLGLCPVGTLTSTHDFTQNIRTGAKELKELLVNTLQCSPPLCQVTVLLYTTQRNSRDKYHHLTHFTYRD